MYMKVVFYDFGQIVKLLYLQFSLPVMYKWQYTEIIY